jgi:protein disulfide-isomerase
MKKLLVTVAVGCIWLQTQAADLNWGTDLPKALAQAKARNKMVLMDFTGSDWCGWCKKIDKETLSTAKFAEFAKAHLELVVVDFPHNKSQGDVLKATNKALKENYGVGGFPTFVVLNANGKEIGRQKGYEPGGPEVFIAKLQGLSQK